MTLLPQGPPNNRTSAAPLSTAMKRVVLLWHTHRLPGGEDDAKLIGVYDSRQAAEAARLRTGQLPGFAENPDGFELSDYEVGQDHWTEGFTTPP